MSTIVDRTRYKKVYGFYRTRPQYQTLGDSMSITVNGNGITGSQVINSITIGQNVTGSVIGNNLTLTVSGAVGPRGESTRWHTNAFDPSVTTGSMLIAQVSPTTVNTYIYDGLGNEFGTGWSVVANIFGATGPAGPAGNLSGSALYNYYNTSSLNTSVGSGSINFWTIPFTGVGAPQPLLSANQFFVAGVRVYAYDKTNKSDIGTYDCTIQLFMSSSGVLNIIGTPAEDSRFISGSGLNISTPTVSGSNLKLIGTSNINTGSFSSYLWFNSGIIVT